MVDILPDVRAPRRARRAARLIMSLVARAGDFARASGYTAPVVVYPADDSGRRIMRAALVAASWAGGYPPPEEYSVGVPEDCLLGRPLILAGAGSEARARYERELAERALTALGVVLTPRVLYVPERVSAGTALVLCRAALRRAANPNSVIHATPLEWALLGGFYVPEGEPTKGVWGAAYAALYRLQQERRD